MLIVKPFKKPGLLFYLVIIGIGFVLLRSGVKFSTLKELAKLLVSFCVKLIELFLVVVGINIERELGGFEL